VFTATPLDVEYVYGPGYEFAVYDPNTETLVWYDTGAPNGVAYSGISYDDWDEWQLH